VPNNEGEKTSKEATDEDEEEHLLEPAFGQDDALFAVGGLISWIDVDSSAVPTFLDPARIGVLSLAGGAMTLEPRERNWGVRAAFGD